MQLVKLIGQLLQGLYFYEEHKMYIKCVWIYKKK